MLATAVKLGVMAAGVGVAAGGGPPVVPLAAAQEVPKEALRVVSLLGDAPKRLPPPRD